MYVFKCLTMRLIKVFIVFSVLLSLGAFIYVQTHEFTSSQPVVRSVCVQLIQVRDSDGTHSANALGTAEQRAAIEQQVQAIWAQAGIHIFFQSHIKTYDSSFALHGEEPGMFSSLFGLFDGRPKGDLPTIVDNAHARGVDSSNSKVLNMFFVDVAPGHCLRNENQIAGMSLQNGNGISVFVGKQVTQTAKGRNCIARMMAHEIGLNLDLQENENQRSIMDANLTGQALAASQQAIARSSPFVTS